MKPQIRKLAFAACVALTAAGCGQKGPLLLPGNPSSIQTEIPPAPGSPTEEPEPGDDHKDEHEQ